MHYHSTSTVNIQGVSNKIDQVGLLLGSDKKKIHVQGLSETKLNNTHPDSAFEINGYQNPSGETEKATQEVV